MMVFNLVARAAMELSGACACAVVDLESGTCIGQCNNGGGINLSHACTVNAQLMRSKVRFLEEQGLNESIQDIMITLNDHYHLIRLLDTKDGTPMLFFYLVLDRATANLVIARRKLADMEQALWRIPDISQRIQEASLGSVLKTSGKERSVGQVAVVPDESEEDDELPPFMRDEVVMKLLGISATLAGSERNGTYAG